MPRLNQRGMKKPMQATPRSASFSQISGLKAIPPTAVGLDAGQMAAFLQPHALPLQRTPAPTTDVSDAVASLLNLPMANPLNDDDRFANHSASASTASPPHETEGDDQDRERDHHEQPAQKPASAQARHNATERQRVRKLKEAYLSLDEVIRSRPDLISVRIPQEESTSSRRRAKAQDAADGAENARGSNDRSTRTPAGPSHLAILQDSAGAVQSLFALVDQLSRRNAELEQEALVMHSAHRSLSTEQ